MHVEYANIFHFLKYTTQKQIRNVILHMRRRRFDLIPFLWMIFYYSVNRHLPAHPAPCRPASLDICAGRLPLYTRRFPQTVSYLYHPTPSESVSLSPTRRAVITPKHAHARTAHGSVDSLYYKDVWLQNIHLKLLPVYNKVACFNAFSFLFNYTVKRQQLVRST